ncbi:MAG: FmdB family transcriptional regulator [Actinomycetota bacterium]|nr:FmdB family transcriptional regulator [Actinomycetota bacterium]
MPTYEYVCRGCGEQLEAVQAFSDDPLSTCPSCGGELRKVFGSVGIVFKGSGFYKTDSRSSSSASKVAASDGSTSATGAPGSGGGTTSSETSTAPGAATPAPSTAAAGTSTSSAPASS